MENKDCLPDGIPADRRSGFRNAGPKQEFFNARSSVDVNRPRDVAPIILIIKSTVNDVEIRYLRFVDPIKQIVQLNGLGQKGKTQQKVSRIPYGK